MELWAIYGSKTACDDADENEVERIKCMVIMRREKQAEEEKKQHEEAEKQRRESERSRR